MVRLHFGAPEEVEEWPVAVTEIWSTRIPQHKEAYEDLARSVQLALGADSMVWLLQLITGLRLFQ